MAEIRLTAAPALGADITMGGNRIRERDDLALVSVAVPQGGDAALAGAMERAWSIAPPSPNGSTGGDGMRAIWTAPDQMFLMFPRPGSDESAHLAAALDGAGYVTTQTDGWVILEVEGPETLAALERLCPLDLASKAFPVGAASRTVMEHMGAMILRLDETRFLLMSARSSAASFLHAVEVSYRNVL